MYHNVIEKAIFTGRWYVNQPLQYEKQDNCWKHCNKKHDGLETKTNYFLPKIFNLVLLFAMLSVVVACITRMSLRSSRSRAVSAACVSDAVVHILNQVFWLQSWFIPSCVTFVDNWGSYELNRLFSVFFVYFGVELSKNMKSVLFYMVKCHH